MQRLIQWGRRTLYRRFPRFMTGYFHYYLDPDRGPVTRLINPGEKVMLADTDRLLQVRFFNLFGWVLAARTVGVWKAAPRQLQ